MSYPANDVIRVASFCETVRAYFGFGAALYPVSPSPSIPLACMVWKRKPSRFVDVGGSSFFLEAFKNGVFVQFVGWVQSGWLAIQFVEGFVYGKNGVKLQAFKHLCGESAWVGCSA